MPVTRKVEAIGPGVQGHPLLQVGDQPGAHGKSLLWARETVQKVKALAAKTG